MNTPDLQTVINDLNSDEVERQVLALVKAAEIVSILSESAVDALRRSPDRVFIAERLKPLGSAIVPPLEELLTETDDTEVKILGSLVLLQFGCTVDIPFLQEAILKDNENACTIARHLVRAHITGVEDAIIMRLRLCKLSEVGLILCLLDLLRQLDCQLPSDLYERFTAENASLEIREALVDPNTG